MVLQDPLFVRIIEILLVPRYNANALWTVAPLVFALVMLQMYFGKYKTEKLGWNTAFGNSITLMWVTMALLKYLNETYGLLFTLANLQGYVVLVLVLIIVTLSLTLTNFHHALPKNLAFLISSTIPVNMMAFFAIVLVMGRIALDWTTFWACVVIFLFVTLVFYVYRTNIDPDKRILWTLKQKELKKQKKIKKIKRKIKKHSKKLLPETVHKFIDKKL